MAEQGASAAAESTAPRVLPVGSPEAADQLGKGLFDFLLPIVTECDDRVKDVFSSQAALSEQIDLLSARAYFIRSCSLSPAFSQFLTSEGNNQQFLIRSCFQYPQYDA